MLVPAPIGTATSLDLTDPGKLFGSLGLGLFAGLCSGLLGIGGGQVLIPGMVILFGVSQRLAQGVSLAFIVPAALVGGFVGSNLSQIVDVRYLKILFGVFLLYASSRMTLGNVMGRLRRGAKKDTAPADAGATG